MSQASKDPPEEKKGVSFPDASPRSKRSSKGEEGDEQPTSPKSEAPHPGDSEPSSPVSPGWGALKKKQSAMSKRRASLKQAAKRALLLSRGSSLADVDMGDPREKESRDAMGRTKSSKDASRKTSNEKPAGSPGRSSKESSGSKGDATKQSPLPSKEGKSPFTSKGQQVADQLATKATEPGYGAEEPGLALPVESKEVRRTSKDLPRAEQEANLMSPKTAKRRAPALGPDRSGNEQRRHWALTATGDVTQRPHTVAVLSSGALFAPPVPARCPENRILRKIDDGSLEDVDRFYYGAGGFQCDRCGMHSDQVGLPKGTEAPAYASLFASRVGMVVCPQCYREKVMEQDDQRKEKLLRDKFYRQKGPTAAPVMQNFEELRSKTEVLLAKPVDGFWSGPFVRGGRIGRTESKEGVHRSGSKNKWKVVQDEYQGGGFSKPSKYR